MWGVDGAVDAFSHYEDCGFEYRINIIIVYYLLAVALPVLLKGHKLVLVWYDTFQATSLEGITWYNIAYVLF